ncbi:MAG: YdiU family protein [Bacteroidetes bacterium]|nr:YdiU family protein [Bacteroidota bacterium]
MTSYQAAPIHAALDDRFYRPVSAANFPDHKLRYRNDRAAATVGLDALDDAAWIDHFGKFTPLEDNLPQPLALCYHGHQFGHYNPDLGDGRGFLFAQLQSADGRVLDLGTKGSGQTPFSRTADGRLTLKGGVREILATEMLEALGVNTSKTFSIIETGEALERHDEPSPTRAAVMVRLSHGHIRIGSFQRLHYLKDDAGIEVLMRHAARHYFADKIDAGAPVNDLAVALLGEVAARIADTAGAWLAAGFVHGVLNTDNFNITGESFDYGPWRFLPDFDPRFVAAYFDQTSRYAYGRQAEASLWAVCRLADCLIPFGGPAALEEALKDFYPILEDSLRRRLCWRLGLQMPDEQGTVMTKELFAAASASAVPFAQIFHDWYGGAARRGDYSGPEWAAFAETLAGAKSLPQAANSFVDQPQAMAMPIETVESLWDRIAEDDDWAPLYAKLDDIRAFGAVMRGD